MKKLCCFPYPPEPPNLNLDLKCVSACCGGRTDEAVKASDEDEVDGEAEPSVLEEEVKEVIKRGCCCCPLRKRKNQAKASDEKDQRK